MEIIIGIWVLVAGLLIGSFLNVCICRIPAGESIVTGRSHCTVCGQAIKSYDLIPVLSYVFLRGRCRFCQTRISPQYPLVELLTAGLYIAFFAICGLTAPFFIGAAFASVLIVIAVIDIREHSIYLVTDLIIVCIGIIALFLSPLPNWYDRPIGLAAASLPLLVAALVRPGGMGWGDVEFAAAAGFVVGWQNALLSLLIACISAAVFGLSYAAVKRTGLKIAIPFGPFLALGFCVSALCGSEVISLYLSLFIR